MLTLAHSPDADDRFMFWPLREGLVKSRYHFEFIERDTQGLNELCSSKVPDICAISSAHYGNVWRDYQPLRMGCSVGEGYGPVLVKPRSSAFWPLRNGKQKGVLLSPGLQTTAQTVLDGLGLRFETIEVVPIAPMRLVFERLAMLHSAGVNTCALLIHEGRLLYQNFDCELVMDIGEEWDKETRLPLPLGMNVISRSLPLDDRQQLSKIFRESCAYAMEHIDTFVGLSGERGSPYFSPLSATELRHYLSLYANGNTLDASSEVRAGFEHIFKRHPKMASDGMPSFDWI